LPHTITLVMKKDLIDTVGYFDTQLRRGQDYDYWIRLSRITEFHKLNIKMAIYRHHGRYITAQCMPVNSELVVIEKTIKKYGYKDIDGQEINKNDINKRLANLNFNFAYQHFWNGDLTLARRSFMYSVKLSPFRSIAWIYLAFSCLEKLTMFLRFRYPRENNF